MIDIILFILAYLLVFPLTAINYYRVENKRGYFRQTAINIDIWANREFRATWNYYLQENGYMFGKEGETISSALGKNEQLGTLTRKGQVLVKLLDFIDKNHCENSIIE